jgi:hypothetical protein
MKKGIAAIGIVLVVVLFSSCMKKGPEEVAKKYYTHFYKGEYDKVQHYVLAEHRSFYALMQQVVSAEGKKEDMNVKVEVLSVECKISDDTIAICSCLLKMDDMEPKMEQLKLKKVDKTWLVDQGKENGMMISDENPTTDINDEFLEEEDIID